MSGRLSVLIAVAFVAVVLLTLASFPGTANPPSPEPLPASDLPASLDNLYPPKAPRPVLFLAMHDLNSALTGIAVDIMEGDRGGAVSNFATFEAHYRESARLVPEWESWYQMEPVKELGGIIATGEPDQIMAAVGNVGGVCHHCHLANMVPVQFKYHWPRFGDVTVEDPVSSSETNYAEFMQTLNASLTGVAINLEQNQPDNARAQLAAFRSRMHELRDSCDSCHDSQRSYFVDDSIDALMADMERVLADAAPDPKAFAALSRRIGEESCTGCHLVHLPAAYSQHTRR